MKAVGYIRRSKRSEEKTVSLEEQERQIVNYCAANGFEVARIIKHDGLTGAKRSRFEEIRRHIGENQAGVLVIYNLDRLARDVAGLLDNLRALVAANVSIHEVGSGPIDIKKATSKLVVGVRGLMDEFFRDVVSEKTKDSLSFLKTHGRRYSNIPPFGYQLEFSHTEIKTGRSMYRLVEEPEEQKVIAFIRAHYGILGARELQKIIKEKGYNGRLSVATIHRFLGKFCPNVVGP